MIWERLHVFSPSSRGEMFLSAAFLLFFIVTFITVVPFTALEKLDLSDTGGGDPLRLSMFAILAAAIGLGAIGYNFKQLIRMASRLVLITFGWCALSIFWSSAPAISLGRLLFALTIYFTVLAAVCQLGARRAILVFAYAILICVVLSVASGLFVPNARHQAWDAGASGNVGSWRGIFAHKNHAGPASATLFILSLFLYQMERRWIWIFGMIAAAVLLVLSFSKTSLALVFPSLVVGVIFSYFLRLRHGRRLFLGFASISVIALIFTIVAYEETISAFLADPEAFTGRAEIWSSIILAIEDRPLLGFGYGGIYRVNVYTPLLEYASPWVVLIPHGHNGYLDVIASIGVTGFALTMWAFVVQPALRIVANKDCDPWYAGMLVSLMVFVLLHNVMESSLLARANGQWVTLLIAIAAIQYEHSRRLHGRHYGVKPQRAS